MITILVDKNMTARTPHLCENCGQAIAVGEKYHRQTGICDGDFYSSASHLDCHQAWFKKNYVYGDGRDDDGYPFLKDDPDICLDEEWIREDYPKVAERLFGKKDPDED